MPCRVNCQYKKKKKKRTKEEEEEEEENKRNLKKKEEEEEEEEEEKKKTKTGSFNIRVRGARTRVPEGPHARVSCAGVSLQTGAQVG